MSRNGLRNRSNICFINSVLQALSVSPFMNDYISRYSRDDNKLFEVIGKFNLGKFKADNIKIEAERILDTDKNALSKDEIRILTKLTTHSAEIFIYISFKEMIRNLNKPLGKVLNCESFLSITKELTDGTGFENLFSGEQNDPHEFIVYILDKLHTAKSTSVPIELPSNIDELDIYYKLYLKHYKNRFENDYSYFVKNFYYYVLKCIECDKCKNKTYDLSPNDVLLLSIPQKLQDDNIRLHDCLDNMFNVENIDYKCENASCDNTHNNRSQKFIISNPKVLIITIKRYLQMPNGRFVKINKMINYPEVLNIQKYYCGNDHREYELYAIINHTGSIDSGHYYSYIRTMKDDGKGFNDQWLCCNDSQVSLITDEQALSSQNAYMLFYNML
jgi:ubiquitin C-terminal hydrolase